MSGFSRFAHRKPTQSNEDTRVDSGTIVIDTKHLTAQEENEWGDGFEQQAYYYYSDESAPSDGETSFRNDNAIHMEDNLSFATTDSLAEESYRVDFDTEESCGEEDFDDGPKRVEHHEFPSSNTAATNEHSPSFSSVGIDNSNAHVSTSRFDHETKTPVVHVDAYAEHTNNASGEDKATKTNSTAVTPNHAKKKFTTNGRAPSNHQFEDNYTNNQMSPTRASLKALDFPGRVVPPPPGLNIGKSSRRVSFGDLSPPHALPVQQGLQGKDNDNIDETSISVTDSVASQDSRTGPFLARPKRILRGKKDAPLRHLHKHQQATNIEPLLQRQDFYTDVTDNRFMRKNADGRTPITPSQISYYTKDGVEDAKENEVVTLNESDIAFEHISTGNDKNPSVSDIQDDFEAKQAGFLTICRETEDLQEQIETELLDMNDQFSEAFSLFLDDLATAIDLVDKLEAIEEFADEALAHYRQDNNDDDAMNW